jgi:YbgC/YbaW family acyl-CoA thioester hydrolase
MMSRVHHYETRIHYGDVDLNRVVYYSKYLEFFSDAREELMGYENFAYLINVARIGFAVYNANLKFRGKVQYGDVVDIRSTYDFDGEFKLLMHQEVWVNGQEKPAVIGDLELVAIDLESGRIVKIPAVDGFKPAS